MVFAFPWPSILVITEVTIPYICFMSSMHLSCPAKKWEYNKQIEFEDFMDMCPSMIRDQHFMIWFDLLSGIQAGFVCNCEYASKYSDQCVPTKGLKFPKCRKWTNIFIGSTSVPLMFHSKTFATYFPLRQNLLCEEFFHCCSACLRIIQS